LPGSSGFVTTHVFGEHSPVRMAVVCPESACVLSPKLIRHIPCNSAVLLEDGSVWHLQSQGSIWSADRLQTAARLLLAWVKQRLPSVELADHLSYELGIPQISVKAFNPNEVDADQWQTRKIAVSLLLRDIEQGGYQNAQMLEQQVGALKATLEEEIARALDGFRHCLDVDGLQLANRRGFDGDLYNFAAHPEHKTARRQFAFTFPVFLRAAVLGEAGSLGARIRDAVDARIPLVRFLASELRVSQSAVRALTGHSIDVVGTRWEIDLEALLAILQSIRPEDRPRDDNAWGRLNRLVLIAEDIFGRHAWDSPLILAWLRETSRPLAARRFDEQCALGVVLTQHDELTKVAMLRGSLLKIVAAAIKSDARPLIAPMIAIIGMRIDRQLISMSVARLTRLAGNFLDELDKAQEDMKMKTAFARGEENRPLLPNDYICSDGSRRVTCLTTRESLRQFGQAMNNCLRNEELFFTAGRQNRFVLGIVDAVTNEPRSAAEIGVWTSSVSTSPRLRLMQHTAWSNSAAALDCRRAISETLALFDQPEYERHLANVLSDNEQRNRNPLALNYVTQLEPERRALQRSLGEEVLEALVKRCVRAADPSNVNPSAR
jgi:hypothetical protein